VRTGGRPTSGWHASGSIAGPGARSAAVGAADADADEIGGAHATTGGGDVTGAVHEGGRSGAALAQPDATTMTAATTRARLNLSSEGTTG